MEEKIKIGKKYNFQILQIKPEEHRMTLTLLEEHLSSPTELPLPKVEKETSP